MAPVSKKRKSFKNPWGFHTHLVNQNWVTCCCETKVVWESSVSWVLLWGWGMSALTCNSVLCSLCPTSSALLIPTFPRVRVSEWSVDNHMSSIFRDRCLSSNLYLRVCPLDCVFKAGYPTLTVWDTPIRVWPSHYFQLSHCPGLFWWANIGVAHSAIWLFLTHSFPRISLFPGFLVFGKGFSR